MGNPSEMGGRKPGERASNFSVTCRRLSQYLREKGSFGNVGLGMTTATAHRLEGKPETPRTLNLLPGVQASPASGDGLHVADKDAAPDNPKVNPSQSVDLFLRRPGLGALSEKAPDLNREHQAAQMTIFYGGKVVVFDNFPPEKARELMAMADRGCPAQISSVEPPQRPPSCPPPPAPHRPSSATDLDSGSETKPISVTATPAAAPTAAPSVEEAAPNKPLPAAASEMPIARSVSLHRFLEKRKERITAKAPYPVNGLAAVPGSCSASPDEEKGKGKEEEDGQWLGLAPQASRPGDSGGRRWPPAKAANSGSDPRGAR